MGKATYTREEVAKHNKRDDAWLIMNDEVYNITNFINKHPGSAVIGLYKGMDATDVAAAFHPARSEKLIDKYLKVYHIGSLDKPNKVEPIIQDFRKLKSEFEKEGLMKASVPFYTLTLLHILLLEMAGHYLIYTGFSSWPIYILAVLCMATAQIQAGWIQHDFGHLSVFNSTKLNHLMHQLTIGVFKGASVSWWQRRHNRHHARTNVMHHDPDIHNWPLFLFGESQAKYKNGKLGNALIPFQTLYWWVLGPPMVTSVLFVFQILHHIFSARVYADIVAVGLYLFRFGYAFGPVIGFKSTLLLFFAIRVVESHWFTWVTSMSHLPMHIENDRTQEPNWVQLHTVGTQNTTGGWFQDWFTGHLNYQVEHHLFPQMPRHNVPKTHARVKAMCEKHGVHLHEVSLFQAFGSVITSLDAARKVYIKQKAA